MPVVNKLDVPMLCTDEAIAIRRLPSRPDKIRMIVRIASQKTRHTCLEKRGKLKETDMHMSANMTRLTRALLNTTRSWAGENSYAYTWNKVRKVFLKKQERELIILIRTSDNLAALAR